jgi:hypothetical protein
MRRLLLVPVALLGLATAGALASVKQADVSASGPIALLGHDSITVGPLRHRHLTCAITTSSPSTAGSFALGDPVRIACTSHVLVAIGGLPHRTKAADEDGKTGAGATVTNANGPIANLTTTSITVQTMSCSIGPSSPSTGSFSPGDFVRMYCLAGVLHALNHR